MAIRIGLIRDAHRRVLGRGESGVEWTANDQDGGPKTACVTNDGIILKATENGVTTWETSRVQRGAQAADLFLVPEGVQVMDLGSMLSPEMIDQMKAQMGQSNTAGQNSPAWGAGAVLFLRKAGAWARCVWALANGRTIPSALCGRLYD